MEICSNFRRTSSALRNNCFEMSSGWSRCEEDDEELLKWAALERLPTFDRLRKGILLGSRGEVDEVEVVNLGLWDRSKLLDRLIKVAQEDNEKFLLKLRDRIDRC